MGFANVNAMGESTPPTDQHPKGRRAGLGLFGRRTPSLSLGLLIFGFGTAAGFLTAFMGLGVLQDATGIVLLLFLTVLMFIAAFGLLLVVFRKPLLRRLFGFAETQIELFADPLTDVAKSAIDRDPEGATAAARDLVQLSLARYAWIATRRWIIGSLTALIAAMAALAGTMLLFQQNDLLEAQNAKIDNQIAQVTEQTVLNRYTVQLAEAARNAELVVEITEIAQELGAALDRAMAGAGEEAQAGTRTVDGSIPVLDPLQDLDLSLIMRITSASRATKPYQFLDVGITPKNEAELLRVALERRAEDLPNTYAALKADFGWPDEEESIRLVDRPASPERGQLLSSLTLAGIRDMEVLNFYGMDLSYAYAPEIALFLTSFQIGRLSFADFSFADIRGAELRGAFLTNARFRRADIFNTSFSSVPASDVKGPFAKEGIDFYNTTLGGADFSQALLRSVAFIGVHGTAMNFDGATLIEPNFAFAGISAATFRGAAILDPIFEGADLRSVDFDQAVVAGADFLEQIEAQSAPGSFRKERFALEEIDINRALDVQSLYRTVDVEEIRQRVGNKGLYLVKRVQPFEN